MWSPAATQDQDAIATKEKKAEKPWNGGTLDSPTTPGEGAKHGRAIKCPRNSGDMIKGVDREDMIKGVDHDITPIHRRAADTERMTSPHSSCFTSKSQSVNPWNRLSPGILSLFSSGVSTPLGKLSPPTVATEREGVQSNLSQVKSGLVGTWSAKSEDSYPGVSDRITLQKARE